MNNSYQRTLNLSDYPATNEGGVEFVKDVFTNMGGRVVSSPCLCLDDYPATNEGGASFVRDVFLNMGGKLKDP